MTSIEAKEIVGMLKELCKALEEENVNPMVAINGFILSGDPAYIRVHTPYNKEIKHKVNKISNNLLLDALLLMILE